MILYGLLDPNTQEVRYVGVTRGILPYRLAQHLNQSRRGVKSHKCNWIRSLLAQNLEPEAVVLQIVSDENWAECERLWIAKFVNLTNATSGGDGFIGTRMSQETRDKIGNANRGRPRPPEVIEALRQSNLGRKHTKEHREKIATKLRGKPRPPHVVQILRTSNLGKKRSPETSLRISLANTGKKRSEEMKAKQSVLALARRKSACKHGHPFTPDNEYFRQNGSRECRACMALRDKARPCGWQRTRNSTQQNGSVNMKDLVFQGACLSTIVANPGPTPATA